MVAIRILIAPSIGFGSGGMRLPATLLGGWFIRRPATPVAFVDRHGGRCIRRGAVPSSREGVGYRDDIAAGRVAFAHLIRVWHGRNGWSHRVLPALADALDLGRLHNSQLSMLRNGKLASPGPEVFLALGRINQLLAAEPAPCGGLPAALRDRLDQHPELLAALEASALPIQAPGEAVLGPGELLEIFVGLRQPPAAYDLRIAEEEAASLSAALAELLTAGRPWRLCREQVLAAYPVAKRQRREGFAAVMAGQCDYSAAELDAELPELRRTLASLGATGSSELEPDQFLELLRQRAKQLDQHSWAQAAQGELAAAIQSRISSGGHRVV